MPTDISVLTTPYQTGNRSWLIPQPGGIGHGFTEPGVLDVSSLTAATHYPNGYVPSGAVLGIITATSDVNHTTYGAYDDTAVDGRAVAAGILFDDVPIPNLLDLTKDPGIAVVTAFAVVRRTRLSIANGATGRGYIDANGEADLKLIKFIN
jgi:hypothetical protein